MKFFCPDCGAALDPPYVFCTLCGARMPDDLRIAAQAEAPGPDASFDERVQALPSEFPPEDKRIAQVESNEREGACPMRSETDFDTPASKAGGSHFGAEAPYKPAIYFAEADAPCDARTPPPMRPRDAKPAAKRGRPLAWTILSAVLSAFLALQLLGTLAMAASLSFLREALSPKTLARVYADVRDDLTDGELVPGRTLAEFLCDAVGRDVVTEVQIQAILDNSNLVSFIGEKLGLFSDQLFTFDASREHVTAEEIADAVCTKEVLFYSGWTRENFVALLNRAFDFDTFSVDGLCRRLGVNADALRLSVSRFALAGLLLWAALLTAGILALGIRSRGVGCLINGVAYAFAALAALVFGIVADLPPPTEYGAEARFVCGLIHATAPQARMISGALLFLAAAFIGLFLLRRHFTEPRGAHA